MQAGGHRFEPVHLHQRFETADKTCTEGSESRGLYTRGSGENLCEKKDRSASRKCGWLEGWKRDVHKGSAFHAGQVKAWEAKEGRTKATGQKFCRRHGLIAQVVRAHA